MKIAVIGGGASGLVTAYLLDQSHDVHLFERHPVLGGNVRTLGGNVDCPGLETGVISENGVSWFHSQTYPNMHRLLEELGVERASCVVDSSIILANGQHCHVSVLDCFRHLHWDSALSEMVDLGEAAYEIFHVLQKAGVQTEAELSAVPLNAFLQDLNHQVGQWLRGIVSASFSVPFSRVGEFPSDMIIPLMRHWLRNRHCTVLRGGLFSYMQEIVNRIRGTIHTGVQVQSVRRQDGGVEVTFADTRETFDRVVMATTPECAFRLLADASPAEIRWLGPWRDCTSRTVAHVSETFYEQRQVSFRTQCDCFERAEDAVVGYNCCMNDLYDISSKRLYSFGAQLEDWIDADDILDVQEHVAPLYDQSATAHRHQIRRINGQNNTYYAGAYLFDGLHEGAITSAMEVAENLGGRMI